MSSEPIPIATAIEALTNDLMVGVARASRPAGSRVGLIAQRWAEVVGSPLGECTSPGSCVDGMLTIHARDAGAASLVRQSSGDLSMRLRAAFGDEISRIRVVVTRPR